MHISSIDELQNVFHQQIPITNHLGLQVSSYENETLRLFAPLQENINHKASAFGGSIYSVCVLAGWGLLYLKMKEEGLKGHIVIYESNISYQQSITSDFTSECRLENQADFERFLNIYKRKKKAKLRLTSRILIEDETCVEFNGTYVVHT